MIHFQDVSVADHDTALLHGITLRASPGELTVLMGPNGAGKSTLVKTLAGELTDLDGTVLLADKPLREWSDTDKARHLAYVPQHVERGLGVDVLDYVLQGRFALHGGRPERPDYNAALQALEECDVGHLALHDVLTCSGGELRRVAIARAIAQLRHTDGDPTLRVLVLDEPTAHLDPRHAATVVSLLRTLAVKNGWTVLTVLHDIPLALRNAHVIAVLTDGRLAWAGNATESVPALSLAYGVDIHRVNVAGESTVVVL